MPKKETNEIQNFLLDLGKSLGFSPLKEVSFGIFEEYDPHYDVVWFLDLKQFDMNQLIKFIDPVWHKFLSRVPIVTFEIEGSNTTSKNQVGNFANLIISPTLFNFVIVNNEGALKENDTYRRGIKIYRTMKEFWGNNNIIFCDWNHIKSLSEIKTTSINITVPDSDKLERSGSGGEIKSAEIYDKLINDLQKIGFCIKQNFTPDIFECVYSYYQNLRNIDCSSEFDFILGKTYKFVPDQNDLRTITNIRDYFYLPKIDIALGFNLPKSFNYFLFNLMTAMGRDYCYYPILEFIKHNKHKELFFPFLGIEIETSSSKHMIGGILNASKYFFIGLLIANTNARRQLDTIKKYLGLKNIFIKEI